MKKNCDTCGFSMFDFSNNLLVCSAKYYGVSIVVLRPVVNVLGCVDWELSFRLYQSDFEKYEKYL